MKRGLRAGMTLIEIMVALVVMAIIATLTAMTLQGTLIARDVLAENDEVQQSARVALQKISRELELAYLTYNKTAINTYRTIFIAEDDDPTDKLWFSTLAHQRLYRNARESDQAEVTIWLEDDPVEAGLYVLLHRESPRIDQEPGKDGVVYPLAYGVRRFVVRYLDPEQCEWVDSWNSTEADYQDRLPRAAQIFLDIMGPDPEDEDERIKHSFSTTVVLTYGKRARCSLFNGASDGSDDAESSDEDPIREPPAR